MRYSKILSIIMLLIMLLNLVSCNFSKLGHGNKKDNGPSEEENTGVPKFYYVYSITQKKRNIP